MVRDSAGIRVIEGIPAAGVPAPIELALVPFSVPLPEFGDILDVALAPDGRIVVLDPLGPHVVVLDSTGAEAARFGGDGDGPGEFRATGLTELVVLGETVAVPDILLQRVTLFDLDGRVLETVSVPVSEGLAMDWRGAGSDRLILRRISVPQRLEMLTLDGGSEELMDLGALTLPAESGPLTPLPVWCRVTDGRLVLGRTDRYSLQVLDSGSTTMLLEGGVGRHPLSEDDLGHLHELLGRSLARRLSQEVAPELIQELLERTPPAEHVPVLSRLRCSPEGQVWVQHALPVAEMGENVFRVGSTEGWGSSTWDVFDLDDGSLRRAQLPSGTQVTRVTRRVIVGYTTDEYGRKAPARWGRE